MFKEKLVIPDIDLKGYIPKCEWYDVGKNRSTYPRSKPIKSTDLLQLIHTDVWGSIPNMARHGYRYLLTFLDDYSCCIFSYPLWTKDEVSYLTHTKKKWNFNF